MLTDEQAQQVRLVLASEGWNSVIRPTLEARGREAVKALVLNRSERAEKHRGTDLDAEDGELRAIVRACNWMLEYWVVHLNAHEHNRRRDELDRQENGQPATANP